MLTIDSGYHGDLEKGLTSLDDGAVLKLNLLLCKKPSPIRAALRRTITVLYKPLIVDEVYCALNSAKGSVSKPDLALLCPADTNGGACRLKLTI